MRKKMYAAAAALALCWSGYRVLRYPIHHSLMPMNLFVLPGRMLSVRSASAGNQMIRRMTFPEPDEGLQRRVIHVSDIRLTVYDGRIMDHLPVCSIFTAAASALKMRRISTGS